MERGEHKQDNGTSLPAEAWIADDRRPELFMHSGKRMFQEQPATLQFPAMQGGLHLLPRPEARNPLFRGEQVLKGPLAQWNLANDVSRKLTDNLAAPRPAAPARYQMPSPGKLRVDTANSIMLVSGLDPGASEADVAVWLSRKYQLLPKWVFFTHVPGDYYEQFTRCFTE